MSGDGSELMVDGDRSADTADEPVFASDTAIYFGLGDNGFVERSATIPGLDEPLVFGVRAPWHAVYHVEPDDFPARPTTNDVFIASVGACMAGTFGGMLAARRIAVTRENCTVSVHGDIGAPDDGVGGHIVRTIHVRFRFTGVDAAQRKIIDRVHPLVHGQCWLSQTLAGSRCTVTASVEYDD